MEKYKKLSIELCGDLDFEGMVIDVTYNKETISSINYEKGIDNMEIEIPPKPEKFVFPLADFFVALEKAKKLAMKCAKEDEEFRVPMFIVILHLARKQKSLVLC